MRKRQAWVAAAVAAGFSGISPFAFAADNLWTGATSTDWNTPTNWSLGRVPVNPSPAPDGFDDAVINISGPNVAKITADVPIVRDIITGSGAGSNGRVDHSAGTASTGVDNWFYVGRDAGTGTYNLGNTATTGGTLTGIGQGTGNITVGGINASNQSNGRVYVGGTEFGAPGATGTFNVNTSGNVSVFNDLSVGTDGSTGVMNVDAGTITTRGWNFIGKRVNVDGGNGTLNMSGGTLTNTGGRTYIGLGNSTGKLVLTGTATYNNPGDRFIVGENNFAAAMPQVDLNGGTLNTNLMIVGGQPDQPGKGDLILHNAASQLNAGEFWIANNTTSVGTATVSAGKITSNGWIAIGRQGGTGTLTLSGNGIVEKTGGNGSHIIIQSLGGTGLVNQTGGQLKTTGGGDIRIGEGATGTGTWNISGGTGSADAIRVGWLGGPALVAVSGSGAVSAGDMVLAEGGTGTVNQTGGSVALTGNLVVQSNAAQLGTYNLSGGTLSVNGTINASSGAFTFGGTGRLARSSAGTINYTGNLAVGDKLAGFALGTDRTFAVSGLFSVVPGVTFDVTGRALPNKGAVVQTGTIHLGNDGSILGTFDPLTTTVAGLANPAGATFISETQGEGGLFNPSTQSVFWVQENAGSVDLKYSIAVPEPTALAFIALGGVVLIGRRRGGGK